MKPMLPVDAQNPCAALADPLRDAKMLGKTGSSPKFLKTRAPDVELMPQAQPHKLRLGARKAGP